MADVDVDLHFPTTENTESGCFRLLELPQELLTYLMQDGQKASLAVKGRTGDDAVLCTANKTYNIRSVTLSNAFCVVTPPKDLEAGGAIIRDSVQEVFELVPSVPKLHRLDGLLRDCEYDEGAEGDMDVDSDKPASRRLYTYGDLAAEVQASDAEMQSGLKQKHVLHMDNHLQPISPSYLTSILELLLNTLVSLSPGRHTASARDLADTLENDHEVRREVSMQVMSWFGELIEPSMSDSSTDTTWNMNIELVVKEIGLGILREHQEPIPEDELLDKWRIAVGDSFEDKADLALLKGNYISQSSFASGPLIAFFPSSRLPIAPTERFADLFLTRARWGADEIAPFLTEIAVDAKERDKLLMKYARSTTDAAGVVWYTARGGLIP